MKPLLAALILVSLFVSTAFAQSGDTLWTQIYDFVPGADERVVSLDQTTDGGIIAGIRIDLSEVTEHPRVVKFWPDGSVAWVRNFEGEVPQSQLCGIAARLDGGLTMVLYTRDDEILLVQCDQDGVPIHFRYHVGNFWNYRNSDVTKASDGGVVLALSQGSTMSMTRFDTNGLLVWRRVWDDTWWGTRPRSSMQVRYHPSLDAYVGVATLARRIVAASVSTNGTRNWGHAYTEFGRHWHVAIVPLQDQKTLIIGDGKHLVVDANGDMLQAGNWDRRTLSFNDGVQNSNGQLILIGDEYHSPGSEPRGCIFGVEGNEWYHGWMSRPDLGLDLYFKRMLPLDDGTIIVAGGTYENYHTERSFIGAIRGWADYSLPSIELQTTHPVIPSDGGQVAYTCTLTTPETVPFSCDLNVKVFQPGGYGDGREVYHENVVMDPGETTVVEQTVFLPGSLPPGDCRIVGTLVDVWGENITSAEITVEKLAPMAPNGFGTN
ncbi:hypothetical protein KQI52_07065 [bacterium]|nr:hypothetical protein [bacterium]